MKTSQLIKWAGLFGIAGGLILFAGDMLLYYNGNETDRLINMAVSSDWRIILSGVFALFATWFYLLGLIPVYYAFKPAGALVRNTVIILWSGILTAYGVVHGAYTAIAVAAKISHQNQLNLVENSRLAIEVNNAIRLFVYPVFFALSVIFIYQVLKGKTLYPKWILLFYPLLPFLLRKPISSLLNGKYLIIIGGGYLNLILILFFTASFIALWDKLVVNGENKTDT